MQENNNELQQHLLEMLTWFDKYCRSNDLVYYAVGGTMLGAARHKGFIPWDDDVDVGMPRADYNRLESMLRGEKECYVLETANSSSADYCYPYAKLYDPSTTLVENYEPPLIRGVFIDIFPLDGLGDEEQEGIKWFRKVLRKYRFYLTRVAAIRKERKAYKNIAIRISRVIPKFIVNNKNIRINLNRDASRFDYNNSKLIGSFFGNWGEKEIVPIEVMGKPRNYNFENISIMGAENYDAYLTHLYGDWRTLPPEKDRVTHHDYLFLDLNNPYSSYKK